jgi:uncharacterized membrane protein YfcA
VDLFVGGIVVALAAALGGATGFGYGIVATPLLVLTGFSLPFVVTANLTISLITRVTTASRLRHEITWRRATMLVAGSIPGLYLGARTLTGVDPRPIKIAIGALVMLLAVLLARGPAGGTPRRVPGAVLGAGLAGGFLGAISSLNGVAPALLLTRDRVPPVSLIADLAAYFVVSNAIALAILAATGGLSTRALVPACALWIPGAIVGNFAGVALAPRVPVDQFRRLTLGVVFVAGTVTIATAYR